ncbi:hypothetical protein [Arcobacter sp.]|uniref:hypothetical protein n=1 Tax=unclassified Arcobacter TaxID=2593671 RepID=UPI003AFFB0CF
MSKSYFRKIISVGFLFFLNSTLFAGSAIIPNWMHYPTANYCLNVSNINNIGASVTIKLYKKDGTIYDGTYSSSGAELNTPFLLQGNSTAGFCLQKIPGDANMGYGVITSEASDGNGTVQLVAFATYSDAKNYNRWYSININGGLPF